MTANRPETSLLHGVYLFGWGLGYVGGSLAIIGLFRDKRKVLSAWGLALFPLSIIVAI